MATPLKVGLAGLGTVGASVVRLIDQQRAALTQRCAKATRCWSISRTTEAPTVPRPASPTFSGVDINRPG